MIEISGITPDSVYPSSLIKPVDMASDFDMIHVSVLFEGKLIFSSDLYCHGSLAFDVGDIVEGYMRSHETPWGQCLLVVSEDVANPETSQVPFTVVFSDVELPDDFSFDNSFLTLFPNKLVTCDASDNIHLFSRSDGEVEFLVWFYSGGPGNVRRCMDPVVASVVSFSSSMIPMHGFLMDVQALVAEAYAKAAMPVDARPYRISARSGARNFDWWLMPEGQRFSSLVKSRNVFLVEESFWMFGSWSKKVEASFSAAMCLGRNIAYDREISCEVSLVSQPVAVDMARSLATICSSTGKADVTLNTGEGFVSLEMILDKVELKYSPQDREQPSLNLTMKPATKKWPSMLPDDFSLFTGHFNESF